MQEFTIDCRRCVRLARYLDGVRRVHPAYHGRPVPPFGPDTAALLVVGLAPGMHGANRTGRPFTGDHAGILLYETLHRYGFASRPVSAAAGDGLRLANCRITNAVKCLPPENKPTTAEADLCNPFLAAELAALDAGAVILALGAIAHRAVLRARGLKLAQYPFSHGAEHALPDAVTLVDSYHCSRYNTQTGRLTAKMFKAVLQRARTLAFGEP